MRFEVFMDAAKTFGRRRACMGLAAPCAPLAAGQARGAVKRQVWLCQLVWHQFEPGHSANQCQEARRSSDEKPPLHDVHVKPLHPSRLQRAPPIRWSLYQMLSWENYFVAAQQ